jgi:hypothetical protein
MGFDLAIGITLTFWQDCLSDTRATNLKNNLETSLSQLKDAHGKQWKIKVEPYRWLLPKITKEKEQKTLHEMSAPMDNDLVPNANERLVVKKPYQNFPISFSSILPSIDTVGMRGERRLLSSIVAWCLLAVIQNHLQITRKLAKNPLLATQELSKRRNNCFILISRWLQGSLLSTKQMEGNNRGGMHLDLMEHRWQA